MTDPKRLAEIEANAEAAKARQDVNDSGLLAVIVASDIPYLLSELRARDAKVARLQETLETARGQVVAFSIKELGADAAVKNVAYIDAALNPEVKP